MSAEEKAKAIMERVAAGNELREKAEKKAAKTPKAAKSEPEEVQAE